MKPYSLLNSLQPTAFLDWEYFATDFDGLQSNQDSRHEKYEKGLLLGQSSLYVSIACNSTWGAKMRDGSSVSSYEGIGYHANTAIFLKGILDSGVPIVVYRSIPGQDIQETWIQGQKPVGTF